MPKNALAPRPANALARQTDPLQSLLRETAEYPQYGELVDFLAARRMMPPIQQKYGAGPEYAQNSVFGSTLPKTGVVTMPLSAQPSSLIHELTHAADYRIDDLYEEIAKKRALSPLEQQFKQGYEKLVYNPALRLDKGEIDKYPRSALAQRLDPTWLSKEKKYRATQKELAAWGMGASVDSSKSDYYSAPPHLDPTMATEFSILLDLATRLQKSQPVTDKR